MQALKGTVPGGFGWFGRPQKHSVSEKGLPSHVQPKSAEQFPWFSGFNGPCHGPQQTDQPLIWGNPMTHCPVVPFLVLENFPLKTFKSWSLLIRIKKSAGYGPNLDFG